ncbi:hypothetical protein D3C80_2096700 [compost metagenome]
MRVTKPSKRVARRLALTLPRDQFVFSETFDFGRDSVRAACLLRSKMTILPSPASSGGLSMMPVISVLLWL